MKRVPHRIREDVYIVGAGFSAGLGYPLTKNLLYSAWERLRLKGSAIKGVGVI